jgi:hypothetical protein
VCWCQSGEHSTEQGFRDHGGLANGIEKGLAVDPMKDALAGGSNHGGAGKALQ